MGLCIGMDTHPLPTIMYSDLSNPYHQEVLPYVYPKSVLQSKPIFSNSAFCGDEERLISTFYNKVSNSPFISIFIPYTLKP